MATVVHTADLVRHAETVMNRDMADPLVVPFIGENQAWDLGRLAAGEGDLPTGFYSSNALRTRRTHRISSLAMGLEVEPIIDPRLQELDQGDWTGEPRTLYDDPVIKAEMERLGSDFRPPNGESMNDVGARMDDFLESLAADLDRDTAEYVWVHTHGVAIKTWVGRQLGWSHEQTYRAVIDNTSRTRLIREENAWRITFINKVGAVAV